MPPRTDTHPALSEHAPENGVVNIIGEPGAAQQNWLEIELRAALETREPVIVDLSQAEMIDSDSVGIILRAADRAQAHDQPFTICAPVGSFPRQVLALLGVSQRARIADSLDIARTQTVPTPAAHPSVA